MSLVWLSLLLCAFCDVLFVCCLLCGCCLLRPVNQMSSFCLLFSFFVQLSRADIAFCSQNPIDDYLEALPADYSTPNLWIPEDGVHE